MQIYLLDRQRGCMVWKWPLHLHLNRNDGRNKLWAMWFQPSTVNRTLCVSLNVNESVFPLKGIPWLAEVKHTSVWSRLYKRQIYPPLEHTYCTRAIHVVENGSSAQWRSLWHRWLWVSERIRVVDVEIKYNWRKIIPLLTLQWLNHTGSFLTRS